jgi:hypothetical protein
MMTSGVLSYQLSQFNGILSHGHTKQTLVRDGDSNSTIKMNVDVQVRSGDYFVTLATVLDSFARGLSYEKRTQIEDIVSDLIYLQDTHKITKNNAE